MQSPPEGQHSKVVLAASGTHVVLEGQQKSAGSPVASHWTYAGSGHVDARVKSSYVERAVAKLAIQNVMNTLCPALRGRLILEMVRRICVARCVSFHTLISGQIKMKAALVSS